MTTDLLAAHRERPPGRARVQVKASHAPPHGGRCRSAAADPCARSAVMKRHLSASGRSPRCFRKADELGPAVGVDLTSFLRRKNMRTSGAALERRRGVVERRGARTRAPPLACPRGARSRWPARVGVEMRRQGLARPWRESPSRPTLRCRSPSTTRRAHHASSIHRPAQRCRAPPRRARRLPARGPPPACRCAPGSPASRGTSAGTPPTVPWARAPASPSCPRRAALRTRRAGSGWGMPRSGPVRYFGVRRCACARSFSHGPANLSRGFSSITSKLCHALAHQAERRREPPLPSAHDHHVEDGRARLRAPGVSQARSG